MERRTLQDPDTGVYRIDYLHDVVRNEIEKANRFGRSFGLLKVAVGPLGALRQRLGEEAFRTWHDTLTRHLGRQLRATDLFALQADGQFCVLLAESDAVGAATFKQRMRHALEKGEPLAAVSADLRPEVFLGCVSYPADDRARSLFGRAPCAAPRIAASANASGASPLFDRRRLSPGWSTERTRAGEGVPRCSAFCDPEVGRRPRELSVLSVAGRAVRER